MQLLYMLMKVLSMAQRSNRKKKTDMRQFGIPQTTGPVPGMIRNAAHELR